MLTSRREFLVWSGAAAAAVAVPRWALARQETAPILAWEEIAPGVRACVDQMTGGNSVVVVGGGQALVVDSKYPFFGPVLLADARHFAGADAGVTLVNTHHHGDHTGGNVGFVGQAKVLAHKKALPRIRDAFEPQFRGWIASGPSHAARTVRGNERVLGFAQDQAARQAELTPEDWMPNGELGDSQTLTAAGLEVQARHFGPGHTDNDVVLLLGEKNVLVAGDLVFNALTPYFDPEGGATARGWIKSLAAAAELCDENTVVVPGHGPVGKREIIDAQRVYLEQLVEAVGTDIEAGLTKEQVQAKTYEFMQGLGFVQAISRALGAVYDELKNQG